MPSGTFNGEPEFYAVGAVLMPLPKNAPAERPFAASATLSAAVASHPVAELSAAEKEMCARMAVSEESYLRARTDLDSRS